MEAPRQRQPAQFKKVTRYFVPAWPHLEATLASPTHGGDVSTALISRKCGCSHGMTALARAGKRLDVAIEPGGNYGCSRSSSWPLPPAHFTMGRASDLIVSC